MRHTIIGMCMFITFDKPHAFLSGNLKCWLDKDNNSPGALRSFSSSSKISAMFPWVGASFVESRRQFMKSSREFSPFFGSSVTNLSTLVMWVVVGSDNSSWLLAVIRWYLMRYGRRTGMFRSLRNSVWNFWSTLPQIELFAIGMKGININWHHWVCACTWCHVRDIFSLHVVH